MTQKKVDEDTYNKKEKKKIEYMSYLFMIFLGGSFPAIGVVIENIAHALGVKVATAVASYSIFTFSCAVMVFATTGIVLEFISLKKTSLITCILLFFGIGTILISTDILIFNIALFIYGVGYGMCFSLAYYYIILITGNKNRASKMALISLVYSVGAAAAPILFNYMLKNNFSWNVTLSSLIVFIAFAFIIAFFTDFNSQTKAKAPQKIDPHLKANKTWIDELLSWPASVYLMVIALTAYVIAETIVILWLPIFGNKEMSLTIDMANMLASIFWGSMIIGRLMATFILKKVPQEAYICVVCTLSGILLLIMATVPMNAILAYSATAITGICFAAAYSTIASTGTTQMPIATSRLTTIVLGGGAVGTVIAPLASSYIETTFGLRLVFMSGAFFMLVITLILLLVLMLNKARNYKPQQS